MEIIDELEPQSYNQKSKFDYIADIFIVIGLAIIFAVIIGIVTMPLIGIKISPDMSFSDISMFKMKLWNVLTTLGAWVIAPLVLLKIRKYNIIEFLKLKLPRTIDVFLAVILVFIPLIIATAVLTQYFQNINIPKSLDFLNSEQNHKMMMKMLEMNSLSDLLVNIIVIGLAPAVLEEIFFRGTLQNLFVKSLSNKHLAILVTSILFTLIHLNIKQFIPMLFLTLFLGYLYHITKSLWLTILVHFINNSMAVVAHYLSNSNQLANKFIQDEVPYGNNMILPALLFIGFFFYWLLKIKKYSFYE